MAPFMPLLLSRFQTQCLSCAICTNVQNSKFKTLKINTQNQIICAYLHPKRRKNGQHPYYHPVACAFFLASSPHFIVFPLVFSDFSRHFPRSVPFTGSPVNPVHPVAGDPVAFHQGTVLGLVPWVRMASVPVASMTLKKQ